MLVYDITDLESFKDLNSWLIEIEKNAHKNVYKILVGNKCDMESERKVTVEEGKDFAAQYNMKFFETSSKESTNVSEAFITMTRDIIKLADKKQKHKPRVIIKLDDKTIHKASKKIGFSNESIVLKMYISF